MNQTSGCEMDVLLVGLLVGNDVQTPGNLRAG